MIARAIRAFPGVVVSMLLAGQALAAPQATDGHATHPTKAPALEQRRPAQAARGHAGRRVAAVPPPAPEEEPVAFVEDTSTWADSPDAGHGKSAWKQTGAASWYGGKRWQGHLTASGVRYDENALTAAHAWLPIGMRVLVSVQETGRSVIVTINDRPGTRRRIIDLSREAAKELGILGAGVAMVTLRPL